MCVYICILTISIVIIKREGEGRGHDWHWLLRETETTGGASSGLLSPWPLFSVINATDFLSALLCLSISFQDTPSLLPSFSLMYSLIALMYEQLFLYNY